MASKPVVRPLDVAHQRMPPGRPCPCKGCAAIQDFVIPARIRQTWRNPWWFADAKQSSFVQQAGLFPPVVPQHGAAETNGYFCLI